MTDTTSTTPREELPQTGGAFRTPRAEIPKVRKEGSGKKYEPALALDLSPSMYWSARDENDRSEEYPHPNSRRAILEGFLPLFISALAGQDSEAAAEQADGSDDKGGVFTVGFDSEPIEIEDLNESNFARKMEQAWKDAQNGGTCVGPAIQTLIDDYNDEFENDPEGSRVHEIAIITDGEPQDVNALLPYLAAASAKRVYTIAILGHGDAAKKTYDLYKKAADDNQKADKYNHRHIEVVLFDAVTNPKEIAEDLIYLAA